MWERLVGGPVRLGTTRGSAGHHYFFYSMKRDVVVVVVEIEDVVAGGIHVVPGAGPIPPHLSPQSQSSVRRACDQVNAA